MKILNKAFTLVELAVVLVIIGLIMGMIIKGKSLFDVAEMRSNVNKILKIQTAVASLLSNTTDGTLTDLPIDNTTTPHSLPNSELMHKGLLSSADLAYYEDNFSIAFCVINASGLYYDNDTIKKYDHTLCLTTPETWTYKLTCNSEITLDDQNIRGGKGKSVAGVSHNDVGGPGSGGPTDNLPAKSYDCNLSKKGNNSYMYALFSNASVK